MFSPEEAAFIDRIREDHANDLPRLIYADWLDEHGDQPRADFIRVQCALARMDEDDPATATLGEYEQALLQEHSARWTHKIGQTVEGLSFRRGMIEAVTVTPRQFLAIGEDGYQRFPIRRFRFVDLDEKAPNLFQSPLMRFVVELEFSHSTLNVVQGARIARGRHFRNLETLDLSFTSIDPAALRLVLRSPVVGRLKTLRLVGHPSLEAESLQAVVGSTHLTELETLDLSENQLTSRNLDRVYRAHDALPKLQSIHLTGNRLGYDIPEFATSPLLNHLMTRIPDLNLTSNEITAWAVEAIVEAPVFAKVRSLILNQNPFRDMGVGFIARSANTTNLQTLGLVNCGLSDDGVRELANSPVVARLRHIDLRDNLITRECVDRIREMSRRKLTTGTLTVLTDDELLSSRPSLASVMWQFQRRNS